MPPDPFENLLLNAFPNPERHDCPGSEKLRSLAENPPPVEDSVAVHVRQCSPCFAEFRTFRDAKRSASARIAKTRLAVSSALVCAALAMLIYWPIHKPASNRPVDVAQLNFAEDSAERGGDDSSAAVQRIQASARTLKISLPASTDPGNYEIEICRAADLSTAIASPQIVRLEQSKPFPSLAYQLSSPALPAGSYAAAWRPQGSAVWHYGFFSAY